MPRLAVLIVAAGKGERAGTGLPKQYEPLAGQPMLRRTVQAFAALSFGQKCPIQVVIGRGQEGLAAEALKGLDIAAPVPGGTTRQESVRLGLEALAKDAPDFVLIHDAARPLISTKSGASWASASRPSRTDSWRVVPPGTGAAISRPFSASAARRS